MQMTRCAGLWLPVGGWGSFNTTPDVGWVCWPLHFLKSHLFRQVGRGKGSCGGGKVGMVGQGPLIPLCPVALAFAG